MFPDSTGIHLRSTFTLGFVCRRHDITGMEMGELKTTDSVWEKTRDFTDNWQQFRIAPFVLGYFWDNRFEEYLVVAE